MKKGFTIIEVLVSIFIIGAMLVVYQVASNTLALNRNAKNKEVALRIASSKIENLRELAYGSLPESSSFSDPLLDSLPQSQASFSISNFNEKTKEVIVTILWKDPGSKDNSIISLKTLITQGGL